jgi:hypothetical protein
MSLMIISPLIGRRLIATALAGLLLTAAATAQADASRTDSGITATPGEESLLARLRNIADPAADAVVDALFADNQSTPSGSKPSVP